MLRKITSKIEHPDFETHLRYASLIATLSSDLKMTSTIIPKLPASGVKKLLKNKVNLVKLTKKSIDQEYQIVRSDNDYPQTAILWLPIKAYYLIYHLLCIIDCIITGKISSLKTGHYECMDLFTKRLENLDIQFNQPLLNKIFDNNILGFTTNRGENLKFITSENTIYQLLMKKLTNDRIKNYKIYKGLSGRKSYDRNKVNKFKNNIKVSIFDFFHMMRLKMNYRDSNFINNISAPDAKSYFEKYYESTNNFYKCLVNYAKELIKNCPKDVS